MLRPISGLGVAVEIVASNIAIVDVDVVNSSEVNESILVDVNDGGRKTTSCTLIVASTEKVFVDDVVASGSSLSPNDVSAQLAISPKPEAIFVTGDSVADDAG
jgi:hypothetical protein